MPLPVSVYWHLKIYIVCLIKLDYNTVNRKTRTFVRRGRFMSRGDAMSQERFDHLEKMIEQLIHMVGHNNAVTEELCQRMDRLETKVDNLEIKVNSLETKVDNLEIKVNSLETKVDNLETKVDNLEIKVNSLETKVDNLEIKVNSLETKVDNLEIKVNSLETKIDNLESKVGCLEAKVDNGFEGLTGMVHLLGDKTEAIPRIESKLDVLNNRLFEQEAEINLLKRAK
ncbi:Major outer membrane lipoprotein Lpp [Sporomusa carbonis]